MNNRLPLLCPAPKICEKTFHWTQKSRLWCEFLRNQESAEDVYDPRPFWEIEQERKRVAATKAHVPVPPTNAAESAILSAGERQLIALDEKSIRVLGLLTSSDVYAPNERLRGGQSLDADAGAYLGYEGQYNTLQQFVDDARAIFASLGGSLTFPTPIRLFRGVGLPGDLDGDMPDIAGLGRHLQTGAPWLSSFTDDGFGFATTDPETALKYDGRRFEDDPPLEPTLFELTTKRGLCVPGQLHRSTALFDHTYDSHYLGTDMGQVVFEPGTRWEITSVHKNSAHGVPLVRMVQV